MSWSTCQTMAESSPARVIRPQPKQEAFLSSSADIVIFGGAAGGGKTFALTLEAMRHVGNPQFGAVVFRRMSTQLTGPGSIWREAHNLFPAVGGVPRESPKMDWRFPSGARIEFSHLQYVKDIATHLSKQYVLIIFDQLEQFEEEQFWGLFARARSSCGVQPYVRAACNPDPDSFLYRNGTGLIAWWIGEDGYPIPERSGVIRWFVRDSDDELIWADSKEELREKAPHICEQDPEAPNSITFIASSLDDNPALTDADPKYKSKLLAMPRVERARLLGGNWLIKPAAGLYFRRSMFEMIERSPARNVVDRYRCWDKAATKPNPENKDPDWTVGVRYCRMRDDSFVIEHVVRLREGPLGVERAILNTAAYDGQKCKIGFWEDPGAAGKSDAQYFVRMLSRYTVKTRKASKDKVTYAGPVSSQAEAGNVRVVRGPWNDAFFAILEGFPDASHDDDVDALSLAHMLCSTSNLAKLRKLATM